jgi:cyclic pyranopterin phosphate synthase
MRKLTHTTADGKATMVDISGKPVQERSAMARGHITLTKEARDLIRENRIKKGDVLSLAEFAGITGGKRTSDLIPLCHPLPISKLTVTATLDDTGVSVESFAKCTGQTGIEMEALTAVSVALLTIYDMCKAVDRTMVIGGINLISKIKKSI